MALRLRELVALPATPMDVITNSRDLKPSFTLWAPGTHLVHYTTWEIGGSREGTGSPMLGVRVRVSLFL